MIGYFLKMKLKTAFYMLCILTILIFATYHYELINTGSILLTSTIHSNLTTIVWWTSFYDSNLTKNIQCKINKCLVTENRNYFHDNEPLIFLFYGSQFNLHDLPLPRNKLHSWAIIHEESPKNLAFFLDKTSHKLFNFTSTFSRFSDFPITLQYLDKLDVLTSTTYMKSIEEKNKLLNYLAPVLYIQSDCVTPLERDSYVFELMKYVPIDSYGQCLNNKKLPENLQENPLNNLYSDDFLHFVAQYKFIIAFENAICDDYITEKLWRPLIAGSVPIYLGSPSVTIWLPNNHSVILVQDFNSPQKLAEHILKINSNDSLYNSFLSHKFSGKIENEILKQNLIEREWSADNTGDISFFEAFECFICDNFNKSKLKNNYNIYNCPDLISPITKQINNSNWWNNHWREGKCQAKVLEKFVTNTSIKNFTKEHFNNEVEQLIIHNKC